VLTDALTDELERRRGSGGPAGHEGRIVSTDLFYEPGPGRNGKWSSDGAIAVEMEASALFAVGASAGIQMACILAVSDTFDARGARVRIDEQALIGAAEAMGAVAASALAV
jgi:5'-methylthioadenosine phosphorylase/purine-nucleoside phosphorylase